MHFRFLRYAMFAWALLMAMPASAASITSVQSGSWLDPTTWDSHTIPTLHDTVTIPAGQTITYDASSADVIDRLTVNGTLRFSHDANTLMTVDEMNILAGGMFEIGTESDTLPSHVTATVKITGMVEKIHAMGGNVEIHGAPRALTWTRLSETARAGTDMLTLSEAVDWTVGDEIVIAPTSHKSTEAEVRTIAGANSQMDGTQIMLNAPLSFTHMGTTLKPAEVGLLTHNILFQGDEVDKGGDIKFTEKGVIHIEHARFDLLGPLGQMGRYPLHFHLMGDRSGSYLKSLAITNSSNRCMSVHTTDGVLLQDIVAYNIKGHCYYLEDAAEQQNSLIHNLGVLTKPGATINTDKQPATFYITNPNNTFRDNAAAGSQAFGYWFFTPKAPGGLSAHIKMNPSTLPLKEFDNNVSHSNSTHGLTMDGHGFLAINYQPPTTAQLTNYKGYSNVLAGIWARGKDIVFSGAELIDNKTGATFVGKQISLKDSHIIGDSGSRTHHPEIVAGFRFHAPGPFTVENVNFEKFNTTENQKQKAVMVEDNNAFNMSTEHAIADLSFTDVQQSDRFYFPTPKHNGERFAVIHNHVAHTTLVPFLPFHNAPDGCEAREEWGAYECMNTDYGTLEFYDGRTEGFATELEVTRMDTDASIKVMQDQSKGNSKMGWFVMNVPVSNEYRFSVGNNNGMRLNWMGHSPITVRLSFDVKPKQITRNGVNDTSWTYDAEQKEMTMTLQPNSEYKIMK